MFHSRPTSLKTTTEAGAFYYSSTVPQDVPPETFHLRIDGCRLDIQVPVVPMNLSGFIPQFMKVNLMATESPQQAYKLCQQIPTLEHKFRERCYAQEFCAIKMPRATEAETEAYSRLDELTIDSRAEPDLLICEPIVCEPIFVDSDDDFAERVSITCVNKALLQECRDQGMLENPYKDIYRMQTMGDGVHIMDCIETLQNQEFLFVVTPYVEHNLSDLIKPDQGALSEAKARSLFREIVYILKHLRENRIIHCNLSLDKFVFYKEKLILRGLGMSFLVPDGVFLVSNTIGKSILPPSYVSPEVYTMLPFRPYALDMWSSTVILFQIITGGGKLYDRPTFRDPLFCYSLLARGLSPSNKNTGLSNEAYDKIGCLEQADLSELVEKCSLFSPELVELFDNALCVSVLARWSLDDVEACSWVSRGSYNT